MYMRREAGCVKGLDSESREFRTLDRFLVTVKTSKDKEGLQPGEEIY